MKRTIIITLLISFMLTGCSGLISSQNIRFSTDRSLSDMIASEAFMEKGAKKLSDWFSAVSDRDADPDVTEEFTGKIEGVWGKDDGFFMQFEGTTLKTGWFFSDRLPDSRVAEVKKLSDNEYEIYVEDRGSVEDEGGFDYQGSDYTVVIDGSRDGFKTLFVLKSASADTLLVRMGDTFEEAQDYFLNGFFDDYDELKDELELR